MKRILFFLVILICWASLVQADAVIPTVDIDGSSDNPLVGRFAGSFIVAYSKKNYDEVTFPLSKLTKVEGQKDNHNNHRFAPEKSITVEGKRTRLVYLAPAGASPLEVMRNYEKELKANGANVLFSCKKGECGGDESRSSEGGGGEMSLAMYLCPAENLRTKAFSNAYCAQTPTISDQYFVVLELPENNAYVAVHTYLMENHNYCKAFNERTAAIVEVLEVEQMQDKMITVKAEEMAESIATSGSVALYGIYFDYNKADIKPESRATLEQISRLLNDNKQMELLVVGHTDNVGNYDSNMQLSVRRAQRVVDALVADFGIVRKRLKPAGVSFACPVAANTSEEGRAKNRRVELVQK